MSGTALIAEAERLEAQADEALLRATAEGHARGWLDGRASLVHCPESLALRGRARSLRLDAEEKAQPSSPQVTGIEGLSASSTTFSQNEVDAAIANALRQTVTGKVAAADAGGAPPRVLTHDEEIDAVARRIARAGEPDEDRRANLAAGPALEIDDDTSLDAVARRIAQS